MPQDPMPQTMSLDEYEAYIARKYGVPLEFAQAIRMGEAAGGQYKKGKVQASGQGARGRYQVLPGTAKQYGVDNLDDTFDNTYAGVRYLSDALKDTRKYAQNPMSEDHLALASIYYFSGPGGLQKYLSGSNIKDKKLEGGKLVPGTSQKDYAGKMLANLDTLRRYGIDTSPEYRGGWEKEQERLKVEESKRRVASGIDKGMMERQQYFTGLVPPPPALGGTGQQIEDWAKSTMRGFQNQAPSPPTGSKDLQEFIGGPRQGGGDIYSPPTMAEQIEERRRRREQQIPELVQGRPDTTAGKGFLAGLGAAYRSGGLTAEAKSEQSYRNLERMRRHMGQKRTPEEETGPLMRQRELGDAAAVLRQKAEQEAGYWPSAIASAFGGAVTGLPKFLTTTLVGAGIGGSFGGPAGAATGAMLGLTGLGASEADWQRPGMATIETALYPASYLAGGLGPRLMGPIANRAFNPRVANAITQTLPGRMGQAALAGGLISGVPAAGMTLAEGQGGDEAIREGIAQGIPGAVLGLLGMPPKRIVPPSRGGHSAPPTLGLGGIRPPGTPPRPAGLPAVPKGLPAAPAGTPPSPYGPGAGPPPPSAGPIVPAIPPTGLWQWHNGAVYDPLGRLYKPTVDEIPVNQGLVDLKNDELISSRTPPTSPPPATPPPAIPPVTPMPGAPPAPTPPGAMPDLGEVLEGILGEGAPPPAQTPPAPKPPSALATAIEEGKRPPAQPDLFPTTPDVTVDIVPGRDTPLGNVPTNFKGWQTFFETNGITLPKGFRNMKQADRVKWLQDYQNEIARRHRKQQERQESIPARDQEGQPSDLTPEQQKIEQAISDAVKGDEPLAPPDISPPPPVPKTPPPPPAAPSEYQAKKAEIEKQAKHFGIIDQDVSIDKWKPEDIQELGNEVARRQAVDQPPVPKGKKPKGTPPAAVIPEAKVREMIDAEDMERAKRYQALQRTGIKPKPSEKPEWGAVAQVSSFDTPAFDPASRSFFLSPSVRDAVRDQLDELDEPSVFEKTGQYFEEGDPVEIEDITEFIPWSEKPERYEKGKRGKMKPIYKAPTQALRDKGGRAIASIHQGFRDIFRQKYGAESLKHVTPEMWIDWMAKSIPRDDPAWELLRSVFEAGGQTTGHRLPRTFSNLPDMFYPGPWMKEALTAGEPNPLQRRFRSIASREGGLEAFKQAYLEKYKDFVNEYYAEGRERGAYGQKIDHPAPERRAMLDAAIGAVEKQARFSQPVATEAPPAEGGMSLRQGQAYVRGLLKNPQAHAGELERLFEESPQFFPKKFRDEHAPTVEAVAEEPMELTEQVDDFDALLDDITKDVKPDVVAEPDVPPPTEITKPSAPESIPLAKGQIDWRKLGTIGPKQTPEQRLAWLQNQAGIQGEWLKIQQREGADPAEIANTEQMLGAVQKAIQAMGAEPRKPRTKAEKPVEPSKPKRVGKAKGAITKEPLEVTPETQAAIDQINEEVAGKPVGELTDEQIEKSRLLLKRMKGEQSAKQQEITGRRKKKGEGTIYVDPTDLPSFRMGVEEPRVEPKEDIDEPIKEMRWLAEFSEQKNVRSVEETKTLQNEEDRRVGQQFLERGTEMFRAIEAKGKANDRDKFRMWGNLGYGLYLSNPEMSRSEWRNKMWDKINQLPMRFRIRKNRDLDYIWAEINSTEEDVVLRRREKLREVAPPPVRSPEARGEIVPPEEPTPPSPAQFRLNAFGPRREAKLATWEPAAQGLVNEQVLDIMRDDNIYNFKGVTSWFKRGDKTEEMKQIAILENTATMLDKNLWKIKDIEEAEIIRDQIAKLRSEARDMREGLGTSDDPDLGRKQQILTLEGYMRVAKELVLRNAGNAGVLRYAKSAFDNAFSQLLKGTKIKDRADYAKAIPLGWQAAEINKQLVQRNPDWIVDQSALDDNARMHGAVSSLRGRIFQAIKLYNEEGFPSATVPYIPFESNVKRTGRIWQAHATRLKDLAAHPDFLEELTTRDGQERLIAIGLLDFPDLDMMEPAEREQAMAIAEQVRNRREQFADHMREAQISDQLREQHNRMREEAAKLMPRQKLNSSMHILQTEKPSKEQVKEDAKTGTQFHNKDVVEILSKRSNEIRRLTHEANKTLRDQALASGKITQAEADAWPLNKQLPDKQTLDVAWKAAKNVPADNMWVQREIKRKIAQTEAELQKEGLPAQIEATLHKDLEILKAHEEVIGEITGLTREVRQGLEQKKRDLEKAGLQERRKELKKMRLEGEDEPIKQVMEPEFMRWEQGEPEESRFGLGRKWSTDIDIDSPEVPSVTELANKARLREVKLPQEGDLGSLNIIEANDAALMLLRTLAMRQHKMYQERTKANLREGEKDDVWRYGWSLGVMHQGMQWDRNSFRINPGSLRIDWAPKHIQGPLQELLNQLETMGSRGKNFIPNLHNTIIVGTGKSVPIADVDRNLIREIAATWAESTALRFAIDGHPVFKNIIEPLIKAQADEADRLATAKEGKQPLKLAETVEEGRELSPKERELSKLLDDPAVSVWDVIPLLATEQFDKLGITREQGEALLAKGFDITDLGKLNQWPLTTKEAPWFTRQLMKGQAERKARAERWPDKWYERTRYTEPRIAPKERQLPSGDPSEIERLTRLSPLEGLVEGLTHLTQQVDRMALVFGPARSQYMARQQVLFEEAVEQERNALRQAGATEAEVEARYPTADVTRVELAPERRKTPIGEEHVSAKVNKTEPEEAIETVAQSPEEMSPREQTIVERIRKWLKGGGEKPKAVMGEAESEPLYRDVDMERDPYHAYQLLKEIEMGDGEPLTAEEMDRARAYLKEKGGVESTLEGYGVGYLRPAFSTSKVRQLWKYAPHGNQQTVDLSQPGNANKLIFIRRPDLTHDKNPTYTRFMGVMVPNELIRTNDIMVRHFRDMGMYVQGFKPGEDIAQLATDTVERLTAANARAKDTFAKVVTADVNELLKLPVFEGDDVIWDQDNGTVIVPGHIKGDDWLNLAQFEVLPDLKQMGVNVLAGNGVTTTIMRLINKNEGGSVNIGGLQFPADQAIRQGSIIQEAFKGYPAAVKLGAALKSMGRASGTYGNGSVYFVPVGSIRATTQYGRTTQSLAGVKGVAMHEMTHGLQNEIIGTNTPPPEMTEWAREQENFERLKQGMTDLGEPRNDDWVVADEAPVYVAGGQWEKLGFKNRAEAGQHLRNYIRKLAELYGIEKLQSWPFYTSKGQILSTIIREIQHEYRERDWLNEGQPGYVPAFAPSITTQKALGDQGAGRSADATDIQRLDETGAEESGYADRGLDRSGSRELGEEDGRTGESIKGVIDEDPFLPALTELDEMARSQRRGRIVPTETSAKEWEKKAHAAKQTRQKMRDMLQELRQQMRWDGKSEDEIMAKYPFDPILDVPDIEDMPDDPPTKGMMNRLANWLFPDITKRPAYPRETAEVTGTGEPAAKPEEPIKSVAGGIPPRRPRAPRPAAAPPAAGGGPSGTAGAGTGVPIKGSHTGQQIEQWVNNAMLSSLQFAAANAGTASTLGPFTITANKVAHYLDRMIHATTGAPMTMPNPSFRDWGQLMGAMGRTYWNLAKQGRLLTKVEFGPHVPGLHKLQAPNKPQLFSNKWVNRFATEPMNWSNQAADTIAAIASFYTFAGARLNQMNQQARASGIAPTQNDVLMGMEDAAVNASRVALRDENFFSNFLRNMQGPIDAFGHGVTGAVRNIDPRRAARQSKFRLGTWVGNLRFPQIPGAMLHFGYRTTPLGILNVATKTFQYQWAKRRGAPNIPMYRNEVLRAWGDLLTGTASLYAVGFLLGATGLAEPSTENWSREQTRRSEGITPWSINFSGLARVAAAIPQGWEAMKAAAKERPDEDFRWNVSKYLQPVMLTMNSGIQAGWETYQNTEEAEGTGAKDSLLTKIGRSIYRPMYGAATGLLQDSALERAGQDIYRGFHYSGSMGEGIANTLATGFGSIASTAGMPAMFSSLKYLKDRNIREWRSMGDKPQGLGGYAERYAGDIGRKFIARTPGASTSLPAKIDIWGEEMETDPHAGPKERLLPGVVGRTKYSRLKEAAIKYNQYPGNLLPTEGGESGASVRERQIARGKRFDEAENELMDSDVWRDANTAQRQYILRTFYSRAADPQASLSPSALLKSLHTSEERKRKEDEKKHGSQFPAW